MRNLLVVGVALAVGVTGGAIAAVDKLQQDDYPPGGGTEYQVGGAAPSDSQILVDFDHGTPPAGWTVNDLTGSGVVWATAAYWGMTNNTNGSGECASCDSDAAGSGVGELDTELVSPSYDFCEASNSGLNANLYYENYAFLDFLDIDVSTDGGGNWVNILSWNEDHGAEDVSLDLSYWDGYPWMMFRFHYYCPGCSWVWYAQVDNFELTSDGLIVEGIGSYGCGGPPNGTPATGTIGVVILGGLLLIGGSILLVLRRRAT